MNQDLQTYIDSCHKESRRYAAYPENITAHFNNVADITVDGDSITPQNEKCYILRLSGRSPDSF